MAQRLKRTPTLTEMIPKVTGLGKGKLAAMTLMARLESRWSKIVAVKSLTN
jgi:hypothetical protein